MKKKEKKAMTFKNFALVLVGATFLNGVYLYATENADLFHKEAILDKNLLNGLDAMKDLASNSDLYGDTEIKHWTLPVKHKELNADLLMFWTEEHRDGLLYSYIDEPLDYGENTGNLKDSSNLALLKVYTYGTLEKLSGNGLKAYTVLRTKSKYDNYSLVLLSLEPSIGIDDINIENMLISKEPKDTQGIVRFQDKVFIDGTLDSSLSRLEYENNTDVVYLNYTYDIIGRKEELYDLRKKFDLDVVYNATGQSFKENMLRLNAKFDDSKYLTDDKDFVELSVTISIAFAPDTINSLLDGETKLNYRHIGQAQSSFEDLFSIRVNNQFDLQFKR